MERTAVIVERIVTGVGLRARADRRWVVTQACNKAIKAMRDLEDWSRIQLRDETLAGRARECHEEITTRILNGRKGVGLSRKQLEQALEYFGG